MRLEKCRADLIDPCHRYQSITDIVFRWGFNNSFFNHAEQKNDPTTEADAGDGFLMRQGYVIVWSGWLGELTPEPAARRGVTWPRTNA